MVWLQAFSFLQMKPWLEASNPLDWRDLVSFGGLGPGRLTRGEAWHSSCERLFEAFPRPDFGRPYRDQGSQTFGGGNLKS